MIRLLRAVVTCAAVVGSGLVVAKPWVVLENSRTQTKLVLVGVTHANHYVKPAVGGEILRMMRASDLIYFEAIDGFFSLRRKEAYESARAEYVRAEHLPIGGIASACALAVRATFPKFVWPTIDVAPAIMRAFVIQARTGVKPPPFAAEETFDMSDAALMTQALRANLVVQEAETTLDWIAFAKTFSAVQVEEAIRRPCLAIQERSLKDILPEEMRKSRQLLMDGRWDDLAYWNYHIEVELMQLPEWVWLPYMGQRNARIVEKILSSAVGKNVLLVVGAGHVGGVTDFLHYCMNVGFILSTRRSFANSCLSVMGVSRNREGCGCPF